MRQKGRQEQKPHDPTADLPPAFRQSRNSPYRRRLSLLAEPFQPKVQRRLGLAERTMNALPAYDAFFVDVDASKRELFAIFSEAGLADADLSKDADYFEIISRLFYDHGVFFTTGVDWRATCRLVARSMLDDLHMFFIAHDAEGQFATRYTPGHSLHPPLLIIDLAAVLERAVYHMNFIHYHQLEPISTFILDGKEEASEKLLAERLKLAASTRFDDCKKVMSKLHDGNLTPDALLKIFPRIHAVKMMQYFIQATYDPDEIQHTVNLCNLIVRSALIAQLATHKEFEKMRREAQIGNSIAEVMRFFERCKTIFFVLNAITDIAYGNPAFRLAGIQAYSLNPSANQAHLLAFKDECMTPMIRRLGIKGSRNPFTIIHEILSCPPEQFARAAKEVLHDEFGFEERHPDFAADAERINAISVVNRAVLPEIVEVLEKTGYTEPIM